MILSDTAILEARARGEILIEPWDERCLGGNSYDVHLGPVLLVPDTSIIGHWVLDPYVEHAYERVEIPRRGVILDPGRLYLGSTVEYTETHAHVPYLDGKSSVGRLGISVHATAGRGDVGFCNHWTLEISVIQRARVYAGMPIGQLTYHAVEGKVRAPYARKVGGTYGSLARDPDPQPSRLWTKPRP